MAACLTTPCRSLYAHVPFCQTICGYCDFYSMLVDRDQFTPFVDAMVRELHAARAAADRAGAPLCVDTIFVGGGTPTTLPPPLLQPLLSALRECAAPDAPLEFTVEANPATVTPDTAAALVAAGVTRVSIGAQAFDVSELRVLDRIHRPEQVGQTVQTCRDAGLHDLNLDLIFAVPGQSVARWLRNVDAALALRPNHLSCYGLTYERGTPLHARRQAGAVQPVDEDAEAEMFEATRAHLARAGLHQYEISNYARPGHECRHNLRYWHNEPHIGLGPSAAGYVDGVRYRNIPDTAAYIRAITAGHTARSEQERLSLDQTARETAMLELRLIDGLHLPRFQSRFELDPRRLFATAIARNTDFGLLEDAGDCLRLTPRGLLLADSVIGDFLRGGEG